MYFKINTERLFSPHNHYYAEFEMRSDQYSVPATGASNDDSYDVLTFPQVTFSSRLYRSILSVCAWAPFGFLQVE